MTPWEDFSPIFCPYLDIWGLASPTMHGEELKYITEAYETNWMSTVGKNINEVEKIAGGCLDVGMDIFERGLCLPSDNKMTAEEQDQIIEIIKSCFM